MKNHQIINKLHNLSRSLSTFLVPEIVWPKEKLIENVRIKLRGEPYSFGVKLSLNKGIYEGPERNLIRSYDLKGENVIEMGGSIGILTAVLADKVGNEGKVISIEASWKISSYSRSWLEKKKNIKVVTGYAFPVEKLEESIEVEKFNESPNNLCGQLSYKILNESVSNSKYIYDIQKISELCNISPTVLVVDIEGTENIILFQELDFRSSIKIILIELHPQFYGVRNMQEIINRITKEGFVIKSCEGDVYLFERKS